VTGFAMPRRKHPHLFGQRRVDGESTGQGTCSLRLWRNAMLSQPILSQRRIAQLGVGAASLTLVSCMTVLIAGARDNSPSARPAVTPVLSETHVPTVSTTPVSLQRDSVAPLAVATNKQ